MNSILQIAGFSAFFDVNADRLDAVFLVEVAAYLVLISRDRGPRLAPFIMALGRKTVKNLLEKL